MALQIFSPAPFASHRVTRPINRFRFVRAVPPREGVRLSPSSAFFKFFQQAERDPKPAAEIVSEDDLPFPRKNESHIPLRAIQRRAIPRSRPSLASHTASCTAASILDGTFLRGRELARCYKASVDGWDSRDFHSRCDFVGPTVVSLCSCNTGATTNKQPIQSGAEGLPSTCDRRGLKIGPGPSLADLR